MEISTLSFPPTGSGILILSFILLHQGQKLFKLLYPLKLYLPLIHRLPVRFEPVQHIMLLKPMLRRIPMILFNEGFNFIISCQPTCLLIHTDWSVPFNMPFNPPFDRRLFIIQQSLTHLRQIILLRRTLGRVWLCHSYQPTFYESIYYSRLKIRCIL